MLNVMHKPVRKFIFLDLSDQQISLVKALKEEYPELTGKMYWIFMKNADELFYHLDANSIIISNESDTLNNLNFMITIGHPFYMCWDDFLKYYQSLIYFQGLSSERNVCLAFIAENYMKLYKNLFLLYGFNVVTTNRTDELEEILSSDIEYLVFDLDMNLIPEKIRFQTMKKISYFCKKGLRANVIKNFDSGSLFNDILSPVKEITNILLSPEEYMLFIRKYLYIKEYENLIKIYSNGITPLLLHHQRDDAKGTLKPHPEIFSDLRDAKKSYNQILAMKNNPNYHEIVQKKNDIEIRFLISADMEKFISESMDNSQRELFTFFPQ